MRWTITAAALLLGTLAVAAPAQADQYYSRVEAQKITKYDIVKRYDLQRGALAARCRPQGQERHDPGYEYHSWVCGWYDGYTECGGALIIRGAPGRNYYRSKVWRGINC